MHVKTVSFIKLTIPLYAIFLSAWAIADLMPVVFGEAFRTISAIIFIFICLGIVGIYLPIITERKYQISYDKPSTRSNTIAGIILFVIAATIEIILFSSWYRIIIENPDDLIRLKHVMITIPMSTAIMLQFFFIAPKSIENACNENKTAEIIAVAISALSMGFGLYAETGFSRIDVLLTMTAAGAFIGVGYLLTGKFFLTFVTIFLAVYANSLSEMRYISYSWPVAITGFIFYLIVLITGFSVTVKRNAIISTL